MTEEPTNVAATGRDEPLAGLKLAAARRARKLSLKDVANELHLDEPKVTALEENRFGELGAPVFVKGYLRKYAEILGVSPDSVLADYRRLEASEDAPPIVRLHRPPHRELPLAPLLTVLLVLTLAGGGLWAWRSGSLDGLLPASTPAGPAPLATERPAAGPVGEDDGGADLPAARQASDDVPLTEEPAGQELAGDAAPERPPEAVLAAPDSVPAPTGQVLLAVTFTGDCWTEVSDAAGARLFFGLGRAGETVSVTGSAPLRVLLGNFANAALTVDGESYAVPPSARRGDTARLTIDTASATP